MPKTHITSLLRPRGRYKSTEGPPSSISATVEPNGNDTVSAQQFQSITPPPKDVEIIRTLNFVVAAPLDVQHVAAADAANKCSHLYGTAVGAIENKDNGEDNHSRHTYVIERISGDTHTDADTNTDTNTDELLQQEVDNLSLTDATASCSLVYEPTSSISIEMDNLGKSATSPATTTDEMAAAATATTTSRGNSNVSAMTTVTTPSSDRSIDEEIEEAIETGDEEELAIGGDDVHSLELSEAAGYTKPIAAVKKQETHHQLFGIESSEEESEQRQPSGETESPAKKSSSDDEQFKIDDEQLSGGKLAQHFLLDDDGDEDDENSDDLDISLPLGDNVVHSRHEAFSESDRDRNVDPEVDVNQTSLGSNQSTADDVSDFVEEPRQGEDSLGAASDNFNVPVAEETQKSSDQGEMEISLNRSKTSLGEAIGGMEEAKSIHFEKDQQTEQQALVTDDIELLGASPEHSEKDNSIEEIVESNESIEMTLDNRELSSLNPPCDDDKNRSAEEVTKGEEISGKEEKVDRLDGTRAETEKMITDLDEIIAESNANAQKGTPLALENFNMLLHEAKIIENKSPNVWDTLLLQAEPEAEEEALVPMPEKEHNLNVSATHVQRPSRGAELASPVDIVSERIGANSEMEIDDDDDNSMELMKLRILAMKHQTKEMQGQSPTEVAPSDGGASGEQTIKPMERVPLSEFSKDVLEDITEESERNSLSTAEEQRSLSMERSVSTAGKSESKTLHPEMGVEADTSTSVVNLNMLQALEHKMTELQSVLAGKDACLAALNLQLETAQRRESSGANSGEQLGSGRDTSSLVTNSTEYRTIQEDFGGPTMDIYMELSKRDELIAKLTDSLQQSLNVREGLQMESDKLTMEVQLLRKQLTEALETLRRPYWPRGDQESNGGQRISEISMDLISESDDELDRHFLTDNEEKYSRNSRERQLSVPRQWDALVSSAETDAPDWIQTTPFSKQIEQFQKYLTPSEVRLFFMVQKKFDDFLSQELEKCKMKCEHELKLALDQLQSEKLQKDEEIQRLLNMRQEKENLHSKEMEDLRKYFETKCADLEKQFSDDVFSHKSQHHTADISSAESSDQEQMPEEIAPLTALQRSKETSPRKRSRAELLLSPSHRQMTPCGDAFVDDGKDAVGNVAFEIAELKSFYQNKIHEMQRLQEDRLRKLSDKVKYYESRYPDDEYMAINKCVQSTTEPLNTTATTIETTTTTADTTTTTNDSNNSSHNATQESVTQQVRDANTSLIIIDQDELNLHNESQVIQKIIEEYERRLQEQLTLAREDIVRELECQIQTLLSESTTDDQHWPPELILLREKFTAKSQLQIAQLQIKHEEEMSRLKMDYEKQLNRKNKRHSTFDSARDFEQIISDRDNLRELTKTFRHVIAELAKCVANCEDDLNVTLVEEVQRLLASNRALEEQAPEPELQLNLSVSLLNASFGSNKQPRLVPDVHNLLELVENPNLVEFISNKSCDVADDFDLRECVERLNDEALYLLHLSEDLHNRRKRQLSLSSGAEKNDSCCEEEDDGRKSPSIGPAQRFLRTRSLNEQHLTTYEGPKAAQLPLLSSLPPDLNRVHNEHYNNNNDELSTPGGNASELNFQVHELKNRLVKSETDRVKLQQELEHTISRNAELGQELQVLRDQLSQLNSLNHTDYAEGYGHGSFKSPQRLSAADKLSTSFAQLQEKARNILSSPTKQQQSNDSTVVLLQMIEDFCREGDKVVEFNKKDREDLQAQIDAADKQLKATRLFLEEQATEREQERDEFLREIEHLKAQLRDKEKERNTFEHASKEVEGLESQVRDFSLKLKESNAQREKFGEELKASIDKIFVLREIITELETQVETKALNEHVLGEKIRQLEDYINSQTRSIEALQHEVQSLKHEISEGYQERIRFLEEKLQNMRPAAEQSMVLDQVVEQLRDIEQTLDQKTKHLESLHHSVSSNSNSATEDISVPGSRPTTLPPTGVNAGTPSAAQGSPLHPSPRQHSLTMEGVQRIVEKLGKHTRVEEAAVKRIRDLEMQVTQMRNIGVELQHERESLQERMGEQTQRISALQSRLEEQRQRAEELQRAGTFDFNIRIHDLQTEVQNLRETLSVRDKQIATMKQQLEKSKVAIDRLEAELVVEQQPDRSIVERLEGELKQKTAEIQKLREKIKNEMIAKLALPDLMETMLADKNEEIDHLKEQLESREKELQDLNLSQASSVGAGGGGKSVAGAKDEASTKLSARTLSDIVSITEFDEPDVVRRAVAAQQETPLQLPVGGGVFLQQTLETSKEVAANLTQKRTEDLSGFAILRPANTFDHPHYFQDPHVLQMTDKSGATVTPPIVPRQINFSALTEDSKLRTSNMEQTTAVDKLGGEERARLIQKLEHEVLELRQKLDATEGAKQKEIDEKEQEMHAMEEDLVATQVRLGGLQHELENRLDEIKRLTQENEQNAQLQREIADKSTEIEKLLQAQQELTRESEKQKERLSKAEKDLVNFQESEERYLKRIAELEQKLLQSTEVEVSKRESLRKELKALGEIHGRCQQTVRDAELRKQEIERLNNELKAKDERLHGLTAKLVQAEENMEARQRQLTTLEAEVERLRQQQNSDNSSKQFSVDEIAQQVEKELNYSAQLDSNILKAIESEEENNLDRKQREKDTKDAKTEAQGTDDENFTGERDLLNQLEALKAQIVVEREHAEVTRHELMAEKQHSQELQEQDVLIIEAMRKRLENALEQEDELHKQLDMERERCERAQTQLTALQRAESRRSSLLKSPSDSPRKSPRSTGSDFDSEAAERLRSEIKMLTAQNERERERWADLQRSTERERQRYDMELQDRVEYCERLKREMEKIARDKDNAEQECDHLQERLTLQTQEIESLEARLATLQEAETRHSTRRERHHKESAQLLAELQELKSQLLASQCEGESLQKTIMQLRCDVDRAAQREAKLAEALANANANAANAAEASVPQQFLQKMKEINALLAENTQENRQMAEAVQFLADERRQLQKKCEDLESQLSGTANVAELEERCNHLLGRYLRVESHRKALVYQKRYLKISLQSYQESEQRALTAWNGEEILQPERNKKKLFKTVALAIIAIQRMKYIGRIWRTGKRIVSKSVFTITQQKRCQPPILTCAADSSTAHRSPPATAQLCPSTSPYRTMERQLVPLQSPALVNECANGGGGLSAMTAAAAPIFDWPCVPTYQH